MVGAVTDLSSRGFALPLAIVAVALLALGLAMAIPSSDQLALEVRQARARLDLERAALAAETRIAHILLTEPVGSRGVTVGGARLAADGNMVSASVQQPQEVVFDGRPYGFQLDEATQVIVRIQERSGLINLNDADSRLLASLAKVCSLSGDEERKLADGQELVGRRAGRSSAAAGNPRIEEPVGRLAQLVSGDRGIKLDAAISAGPAGTGMHLPTAPAAVVLALFGGDVGRAKAFMDQRNGSYNTTKMNVLYNQNEYKALPDIMKRRAMTGQFRVVVEILHSKLTVGLPVYFYQSGMDVDVGRPHESFMAKGPIVYAGRYAQCFEHPGEVVEPLPAAWQWRR